jgi:CcmD family protein
MMRRLSTAVFLALVLASPAGAQPPQQPAQQDEFVPISELPPQEQLPAPPLLIGAYAFAWLALGGYVLSLSRRLTSVQRELDRLEAETRRKP